MITEPDRHEVAEDEDCNVVRLHARDDLMSKVLQLAEHIASFKTEDMERVFCEMILKIMNPPTIYKGRSDE